MTAARFGALWLVAAVMIAGLVVIASGHVRIGGCVVAGALVAAAIFRLMLPPTQAGGLVVRSRTADVIFTLGMGLAMFVIVVAVDLTPRT